MTDTTGASNNPGSRLRAALAILAALLLLAGILWLTQRGEDESTRVEALDAPAECGPVLRHPTEGAGAHVNKATYTAAPPSFGDHAPRWEVRAASFYDVQSRPAVPVLVHNLEHGYNIVWYDQTVLDDDQALRRLQAIASKYDDLDGSPDPANAIIAAPWTAADGADFPRGMHYAFTHWYADPDDRTRSRADEAGLTKYCSDISADLVHTWMADHPLAEAPEGFPDLL